MRCEADQVQGRRPYLVTRTAVLGVGGGGVPLRLPFTPTSREIKVSEACRRSPHLRLLRLRSPSLGCLGRVAGPRTVRAYHSGHLL